MSTGIILYFQSTVNRNKEQIEKVMEERDNISSGKHQAEEAIKKLQRQMRDLREEASDYQKRELETNHKKQELVSIFVFSNLQSTVLCKLLNFYLFSYSFIECYSKG